MKNCKIDEPLVFNSSIESIDFISFREGKGLEAFPEEEKGWRQRELMREMKRKTALVARVSPINRVNKTILTFNKAQEFPTKRRPYVWELSTAEKSVIHE